jgi:hypothetical protein
LQQFALGHADFEPPAQDALIPGLNAVKRHDIPDPGKAVDVPQLIDQIQVLKEEIPVAQPD